MTEDQASSWLAEHPEREAARERLLALEREVVRLLAVRDELIQIEAPAILLCYQLELGPWELPALEAELAYRRVLRAVELARSALAKGERPAKKEIEATLERELHDWHAQVDDAARRLRSARAWATFPSVSAADYTELKALYRQLVRRLHPDLHGSLTADQKVLWSRVQEAFLARDLEALRDLTLLVGVAGQSEGSTLLDDEVARRTARFEARRAHLTEEMARLQEMAPFNLKPLLDDSAWVEARRRAATSRRDEFEGRQRELEREWLTCTGGRAIDQARLH